MASPQYEDLRRKVIQANLLNCRQIVINSIQTDSIVSGLQSTDVLSCNWLQVKGMPYVNITSRYVGATTGLPPIIGNFAVNYFVISETGTIFICIEAGSPGTWREVG